MELFDREFNEMVERHVLEGMFYDGILIADINGIVRYIKNYINDAVPYDVKDAVGRHILELYTDIREEDSTLLKALKGIPTLGRQTMQTAYNGKTCIFYEYTTPLKVSGRIVGAVSLAKFMASFTKEVVVKPSMLAHTPGLSRLSDIIGTSQETIHIREHIKQVANTGSTVLITGETGTGKELVAQAIHTEGPRRNKTFVSQNCSAIPVTILEGLLFGTVKGSFTGAENRPGLFEVADGGTLFLDEINSMDINMQAKILKAIEEKRIRRLGAERDRPIDVRVISAMNEDPKVCIEQGRLRKDLFYRMAVVQIRLSPLRERREDIPAIAEHYIEYYNSEMGKNIMGMTPEAESALYEYDWPGNIRELKNVIEGIFNFRYSGYIEAGDLNEEITMSRQPDMAFSEGDGKQQEVQSGMEDINLIEAVEAYEKKLISKAASSASSLHELAQALGISRQTLSYKLKKYEIGIGK